MMHGQANIKETTVFMRHLVLVILKQVDFLKLQGRMSYSEGSYLQASDKMRISIVDVQNQENGDWESRLL